MPGISLYMIMGTGEEVRCWSGSHKSQQQGQEDGCGMWEDKEELKRTRTKWNLCVIGTHVMCHCPQGSDLQDAGALRKSWCRKLHLNPAKDSKKLKKLWVNLPLLLPPVSKVSQRISDNGSELQQHLTLCQPPDCKPGCCFIPTDFPGGQP